MTTYTSNDHESAGTNDRVFLSITGSKGKTSEHEANNDGNDRERGQEDIYKFTDSTDIGNFQCVFIRKEDTDGWLIKQVCLQTNEEMSVCVCVCVCMCA